MRIYNKLVGDKIIEIIERKGEPCRFHIADDFEYREKLNEKLLEEVNEFIESGEKDEIADILEVIDSIIELNNFDKDEIKRIKKDKFDSRGGFYKRTVLLEES